MRLLQSLEQTNYPLVVIIGPGAELEIQLGYETARFTPSIIRRTLDHLRMLLEGFMANPEVRLVEIPLLNDTERRQLLARWNQAEIADLQDVTLQYLLQQQVKSTPEAIALHCQDHHITYAELDRRTNQLAHYLHRVGVGPEERVGLCMDRSLDLVIGLSGILKAGGAYVPLDPCYPQERLAFILEDAQVSVLLTQQKLMAQLPSLQTQVICVDTEQIFISQESIELPYTRTQLDNAAYVIYTSGSTGIPKGVVVTHRSLLNHCTEVGRRYELQANDRVLQFASISFDVAIEELFPSWLHGATVVMWPDPIAPSPDEFSRIRDGRATDRTKYPFLVLA